MNQVSRHIHHTALRLSLPLIALLGTTFIGCAGTSPEPTKTIYESGLNTVRLETDPDSTSNAHPATLSATEIGTILGNVRAWEQRNFIHRLFSGEADRTRAFRHEEVQILAPALSKGLAQASPAQRVFFHLSHATEHGEEESTTGWLSIRNGTLYLSLSEVHDLHGPGPDISKYDRQMPNVPERSAAFNVTFEPEDYLIKVRSGGRLFSPDQREELQIRYRDALAALPVYPGLEPHQSGKPSQP
ncbi:conserved exported protein of unknown function [Nitrospira japonica]|uniref:Lipoprotein n=1 Tax=Nitrospira japonica TaxID=1325564 RepID=A0A1W1I861_9BACT|nr:hypothetical protein [Nitrospira japonica]SLM48993.1 conserved exported protein of unknown function [Nitrospira japonica]